MQNRDTFLTIGKTGTGIYKEKGSKFLAFAYRAKDEAKVKEILTALRKEYYDANHHCFAYRLGNENFRTRSSDDGEPSGTAGFPILGQIQSKELTEVLIVVIRYFGGIKLGVSGLIRAYREAASEAIANAELVHEVIYSVFRLEFEYQYLNDVMRICKEMKTEITFQLLELSCILEVQVRKKMLVNFESRIKLIKQLKYNMLQ